MNSKNNILLGLDADNKKLFVENKISDQLIILRNRPTVSVRKTLAVSILWNRPTLLGSVHYRHCPHPSQSPQENSQRSRLLYLL